MPAALKVPARETVGTIPETRSTNPTPAAPPRPRAFQAQLLYYQKTVGNQATGKVIRSGLPQLTPRISRHTHAQPAQPVEKQLRAGRNGAVEESKSIQPARPATLSYALPRQRPTAPHIQREWYNFDIPFTDYQFDPSLEGIKTAAGIVKDTAVAGFEWILDQIKSLVASGVEWLSDKWNSIQEFASSAFESAKNSFADIIGVIRNPLGFLADALMSLDADALSRAWATFSGLITTVANGFKVMTDGLLQQVNKIWSGIDGFATSLLNRLSGLTENWMFRKLPDALQRIAFSAIDRLKSLWKSINDGWTALFGKINAWLDGALDTVFNFVRRVLSFGINVVIAGIVEFGKIVLFLKDLFSNPQKYVALLATRTVQAFDGVESQFAGVIGQYFGSAKTAPAQAVTTTVHRSPGPEGPAETRRSATWSEIGDGIAELMGQKWKEFKSNPMAIVTGLLMDMILPIVGNVKDVVQLFSDIKKIVTGPLSAGSLEELWTSLLQILDIPILIYHTVVSILMRTLMLPLIVATFIPHPLVKGIAAAVGYGLLAAFVQAEVANLGQKLLLLKTGSTTAAQKHEAYNRIADSLIALAMTAVIIVVMIILHFIANIMKGVYNFVKGKVFRVKPAPVEGKGTASGEGKGGAAESKGPRVEFEEPSLDGQRKTRMLEDGTFEVCTSPCDMLRRKYAKEIAKNSEFERRISEIETAVDSKSNKARRYRQIEQELAKANRVTKELQRVRDNYADQLKDPANKALKERLDAAEKIADPDARLQALAEIEKELWVLKHPAKPGAYHGPKPEYTNPGHHDPKSPNFRGGGGMTTLLPDDAAAVFRKAIPDAEGRNWYGRNASGEIYRYAPNGGSSKGVHWNGREISPRGLVVPPEVRARFRAMDSKSP